MNNKSTLSVETIIHLDDKRKNIPTAEYRAVLEPEEQNPVPVAYERRNRDLDPQLVWHGKDEQDWSDLVVQAPPLYIQEKIHPKVLVDDLMRHSMPEKLDQTQMFSDFNGIPEGADKTEFYQHDQNWSNRMILGDSLQVMASLAEREGLRGKVQCIYIDPPYGIKFNSNFQWSTTSRDVKDGNTAHITREPEQVKAFRDTWRDGIHSYLTYLRDRLTVARELLTESGSVFVQIGDENVHRVRALMDEVFGDENYVSLIQVQKTGSQSSNLLANTVDFLVWYAKSKANVKYRQLYAQRNAGHVSSDRYDQIELSDGYERRLKRDEIDRQVPLPDGRVFQQTSLISAGAGSVEQKFNFQNKDYLPGAGNHWKTTLGGLDILAKAGRIGATGSSVRYKRYINDFPVMPISDRWESLQLGTGLIYVVQTSPAVCERCILMTSDPGDLVLDPTCGSGTSAFVSELWGRRWITIDTSRVALALSRARIMGARYPYFLLADSRDGHAKESLLSGQPRTTHATFGNIRHGFVYDRVRHIQLGGIAKNAEVDVIWQSWQKKLAPLLNQLNDAMASNWQEWEVPREAEDQWPPGAAELQGLIKRELSIAASADTSKIVAWLMKLNTILGTAFGGRDLPDRPATPWPDATRKLHADWWSARIERQKEIDASIAANADTEYLYDKPCEDKKKVRVAGPFTVESLSPHRVLGVDENGDLIDPSVRKTGGSDGPHAFVQMILENLRTAGIQQAHKDDKVNFTSLTPWPGDLVCAEGRYIEAGGETGIERRAGIFIGPEFGTVTRPDLVEAACEAADCGFDVLVSCAFNYEAQTTEFSKLGRVPILKARMNAELHMSGDLKNTGKGNLFVVFGEPDIDILEADGGMVEVRVNGVDVFHPNSGEVRSDDTDGIACWFIDTDYNQESFFVRHAYFLGANDPYNALKTTLKSEVNEDAWSTLHSAKSRPFKKPSTGRIAVKVINHLGDEVMKVFKVN